MINVIQVVKMAIDFVIGALLLLSAAVNLLALAAFRIIPSLRTTSNWFVMNLLVVNLASCIILAPSLLLNSDIIRNLYSPTVAEPQQQQQMENIVFPPFVQVNKTFTIVITTTTTAHENHSAQSVAAAAQARNNFESHLNSRASYPVDDLNYEDRTTEIDDLDCEFGGCNRSPTIDKSATAQASKSDRVNEEIIINSVEEEENDLNIHEMRPWALDVAAALGALSVVLVVGDIWFAVTDPLRYQSRLSATKVWLLIGTNWVFGIAFGLASAFRTRDQQHQNGDDPWSTSHGADDDEHIKEGDTYNTAFSLTFFVAIILVPFSLICGMYWRIFREARRNGLRMRQNGSSPLLQSALNLTAAQPQGSSSASNLGFKKDWDSNKLIPPIAEGDSESRQSPSDGLTLKIDDSGADSSIAGDSPTDEEAVNSRHKVGGGVHNMSVYDVRSTAMSSINCQQMRRNQSARQLFLFGTGPVSAAATDSGETGALAMPFLNRTTESIANNINNNKNECLLHKLNNLKLHCPEVVRHVHSTPDLHTFSDDFRGVLGSGATRTMAGGAASMMQHSAVTSSLNYSPVGGGDGASYRQSLSVSAAATSTPPQCLMHGVGGSPKPQQLGYMTSIRHRLSNASSLFKYREESRAARISILVVIMFLVSYVPFGLLVVLGGAGETPLLTSYTQTVLAILAVVLANISSPIIFAYRNKRVRRGIKRLLSLDTTTSTKQQKQTKKDSATMYKQVRRHRKLSIYRNNLAFRTNIYCNNNNSNNSTVNYNNSYNNVTKAICNNLSGTSCKAKTNNLIGDSKVEAVVLQQQAIDCRDTITTTNIANVNSDQFATNSLQLQPQPNSLKQDDNNNIYRINNLNHHLVAPSEQCTVNEGKCQVIAAIPQATTGSRTGSDVSTISTMIRCDSSALIPDDKRPSVFKRVLVASSLKLRFGGTGKTSPNTITTTTTKVSSSHPRPVDV